VNAVLRIARREVWERRVLLWAGLGFGLLTLTLLVLPATGGAHGLGEQVGLLICLAYPAAAALAVGGSLLGRDLALGRLSFYFSRPLSAGTLWAGKFLGGAALVVGALFCCSAPMFLTDKPPEPGGMGVVLLALLCLMGIAYVMSAMYRSGSRLVALDLGLGALFVVAFGALVRHLEAAGAGRALWGSGPTEGLVPPALAVATMAILGAAAAQLAYGRGDAPRGHVALSAAIWGFALLVLVASALWGRWVLGVTPGEVGGVGHPLLAAPRGRALFFRGTSQQGRAGFSPVFLMDDVSGSYVRLPPEGVTLPTFSGDGRRAAWVAQETPWWAYFHHAPREVVPLDPVLARVLGAGPNTLAMARLDRGAPLLEEHPLPLPDGVSRALALDGDGRRVLLSGASGAYLLDTDGGKPLASVAVSDVLAAEFLADGAVRFYQKEASPRGGAALVVLDWRPQDGSRVEKARTPGHLRMLLLARRGDLCVASTETGVTILDAASGALRSLESGAAEGPVAALVLSSGQVALALNDHVRVVSRDGKVAAVLPLEPGARAYALREPQPGVVAVGLWALSVAKRRTLFMDASTGAVVREEAGILPAGILGERQAPPPEAGSLASRLFMDQAGALLALEADGRKRVIVAAPE
jgi:hypothetical protein